MLVYRSLRRLTLVLRSVQTALLGASFVVSDYAQRHGEAARTAAHKSLDRQIDRGYAGVDYLKESAQRAQALADNAAIEWQLAHNDIEGRRALIEREVL